MPRLAVERTWRWVARGALGVLALVVALAGIGATYQAIATEIDERTFGPPGRLVDMGDHRLHLLAMGDVSTGPTVILEAGATSFSAQWAWVQPEVAKFARAVAYDRAGLGWSEPSGKPRDAVTVAQELHMLLERAEIPGPYVFVGHSLGGAYGRVFADLYPGEVVGMVLLVPLNPDAWSHLPPEALAEQRAYVDFARMLPILGRFGVMRVMNPIGDLADGLPREWADAMKALSTSSDHLSAARQETLQSTPTSATVAQVRAATMPAEMPLIVLSEGEPADAFTRAQQKTDEELAARSSAGRHRVVAGADHFTLVTERQYALVVVEAIRAVIALA